MIQSQPGPSRFKAVRPFPLHRLPSLLKRSLSLSQQPSSPLPEDGLAKPSNRRTASVTSSHILLDLLPSVRSNQFVWTYTRLLCTSSSYIAGMAFYNFIAALLSLGHQQMRIYDVLGASHPTHNRRKLLLAWASTSALLVLVVLVVNAVVKMSERNFAYQIHREREKMERIEAKIKRHRSRIHGDQLNANPHPTAPSASAPAVNGSLPNGSTEGSEDDEEEEEEAEQALLASLAPTPASAFSQSAAPLAAESADTRPSRRHTELLARIQAEEDKRAVCRALISSSTQQTAEEIEEEEDAEEALEEALEAGLSAADIAREASSQRHFLSQHDPIRRISSSNIFLYRLCDLVCYYIIFVAVYAFQNTLQLSIQTDTLLWSTVYFVGLLIVALGLVHALQSKQDGIGRLRLEQEQQPQSLHDRLANRWLKQLKIQQATWRKMSTFVASSFAYLLAYAVWSVMQALLRTVVPGELMKHPLWLWFNALVLLACSGAFLVLLNVRVYSSLGERPQSDNSQPSALHLIRWPSVLQRLVGGPRASTAGLLVRVDILSGQVTSIHQQMTTEALSYILALSIGAALTSSLPAVPSDAATYNYDVQPSSGALLVYALTCSLVLALSTLWLERWVRRMERKNREKARDVLKSKVEGRERIEIREVTNGRGKGAEGQPPGGRTAEPERFSANTHESALYILKRQYQYERRLRGEDDEAQTRRKQGRDGEKRNGVAFAGVAPMLPSPSSSLATAQPQSASASSPLLSPSSAATPLSPSYGAMSPSSPSPDGGSLLLSPLASPVPSLSSPSFAASSSQRSAHRSLLTSTFLHEYYVAIVATLTQGFALLVAYAWTGVFSFVLFPALRRWSFLIDVGDVEIAAVWSFLTFSLYVILITGAARIFHKEEAFEL